MKSGNVVLSVAHGGCYFAHVGSRGISARACCWGDCLAVGAIPGKRKRSLPSSRVIRSSHTTKTRRVFREEVKGWNEVETRDWQNGNPYASSPEDPKPLIMCSKAKPIGYSYTKAGAQQVSGKSLNCNGGVGCDISHSFTVSVSTSVSNEKTTTLTQSNGVSVSVNAGVMMAVTATTTVGYNHDWAKAVSDSLGMSTTDTVTTTHSLSIGLVGGMTFNAWWTPTLRCQSFKTMCNEVEQMIEKCEPVFDSSGEPAGDHGVMVVG
ncbi:hypothetical protein BDV95DRAFT_49903 [Massariosphaeria phaeospora]|uniref:Uncharacterized protein n=1 Tax=Massariosphaeria phaeospora TaxID=100035 RepID=A0A7C8I718_9PLEO|nr:hypothetical protein BDV95DRAFT_49903 [Massariosphaeria phaeospora]